MALKSASLDSDKLAERRRDLRNLPAPEPAAGIEAYHRERELALAASPEKRANYEKFIGASRQADVDYLPVKLDIENVSRCNFRCAMCAVSKWEKGQRAADLSLDAFRRIIDEQIGLVEIKLQGLGEPLMQRDDFFEMIRYARARHIWVRTTTNASLLHLQGKDSIPNFKKLVDADPNEIQISIDGADQATYESIRRGANFERVIDNCRRINAYCRERGVVCTKMWTVVQKANVNQLEMLVDLAGDLGFLSLVFSLNLTDWGIDDWRTRNNEVNVQDRLVADNLRSLIGRGEKLGVSVRFWNVNERYRLGDARTLCPWPFERAYIGSDLRVSPCCYIGNPDVAQVGEAIADDAGFSNVWLGEEYRAFRRAHLEGDLPEFCKGCYTETDDS